MIIRASRPDELGWLCERTGIAPTGDMRAIEAVEGDRILAQIAAEGWTPNGVRCHIAVDDPHCLRALVREATWWIFEQTGRGVIFAIIKSDHVRSLRLATGLGLRETNRIRDGWDKNVDLVCLELRREWCRWHRLPRKVAA